MKKENLKNVRGSSDFGGKEAYIRSFISETLQETFKKYGYEPLETALLCYYDLLALKYDENNDILKEIYKVSDQANRSLGLRYDLTVPFVKYIANNKNIKFPYKRYEIGKVFRDGPIKKGRSREFVQCDVDCVGISGQMVEAELIAIFIEGYTKLGIEINIKYNNRKLMNGIIELCDINKEYISQVITVIDKIDKLTKEEIEIELKNIGLTNNQINKLITYLSYDFETIKINLYDNSKNINQNLKEGIEELSELNNYIKELQLTNYVSFSSKLARGQEYYTGTVFEVYAKNEEITSSIGGGGRYDKIIGDFIDDGKIYPAVGISFGLDVIFEILKKKMINKSNIDVFIIPFSNNIEALKMATSLRSNGFKVDIDMCNCKLKKSLNYANNANIPLVIIIGEEELKNNKVVIKDMINNNQFIVDIDDTINAIKNLK